MLAPLGAAVPLTGALAAPPARRQSPVPRIGAAAPPRCERSSDRSEAGPGRPRDRGAHRDMNARTFLASIAALRGYFDAVARGGMEGAPLAALRALALDAEARMLRATGGVNTHRGAIFTIGLLAAAAGQLQAERAASTPPPSATRCGAASGRRSSASCPSPSRATGRSSGAATASEARAEAAAGFPHLFEVALPALDGSPRRGRRAAPPPSTAS